MTKLDRAIIEYREDPSDENYERLMAAQREHVADFFRRQAAEFIRRTKRECKNGAVFDTGTHDSR